MKWPTEIVGGIPHYVVCKYAKGGVDDPYHAPLRVVDDEVGTHVVCICSPGSVTRLLLPAY